MSEATVTKEGSAFTLPQFITLTDKDGYYLAVDSNNSLSFSKPKPDANCTFEVINLPNGRGIELKGANGKIVNQIYYGWFRCEGPRNGCPFDVINAKDNQIYLHSQVGPVFMTNYQHHQYSGLNAYPYADSYCLFTVSTPN